METVIACAVVVIVLGIIFMGIFHRKIGELLDRAEGIGFWKWKMNFNSKQPRATDDDRAKIVEELTRGLDNDLVREFEDDIQKGLTALSDKDQIKVLRRHYAATRIAYYFQEVYSIIWGSQLSALEFLNSNTAPRESLRPFYVAGASQYPSIYTNDSFDRWLGFLESQLLIKNGGGQMGITIRGREFLTYLTNVGLSKIKAG